MKSVQASWFASLRQGSSVIAIIATIFMTACGAVSETDKMAGDIAPLSYPEDMPIWMSQGLEMCRQHQLSEGKDSAGVETLARTFGWKPIDIPSMTTSLTDAQRYSADGGRYLYQLKALSMTYGLETVLKCQILQLPEPFGDPLPETSFATISNGVGMSGQFELVKTCPQCPDALLGQWAWQTGGTHLLISAQADASTTISILFTNS